nr:hypothetical protein 9 [Pseudomonadaceae bacterium]
MSRRLLEAALTYAELGYPVFPCVPGQKEPLCDHGVHDATVDAERIERWWAERPNANVAIATAGLLVLDIDSGSEWLSEDEDRAVELMVAPLSYTGGGGRHFVFRQPEGKCWRNTTGRLSRHVDTRADGGYFVVPPSVLSGNGTYRWAEGMVLDLPPEELPEPPGWLVDQLDQLANGGHSSPRVASEPIESNQIPTGQRNATLARLAGTMRRVGMSRFEITAALHQANADRCVPALASAEVDRISESVARYEPDQVAVAVAENHWDQMYAAPVPEEVAVADPGPVPEHLLRVPGFVSEVIDYTIQTAPYPEPALAFCGAVTLQASLAGRKVRDASDNRTTVYLLALANSGAGKDYPRKVNQRILFRVGMSDCVGDTFASGEGIEDRLFVNPAVLFQTDEIDGLMTKINQARDARHEGIMNVLLKMYTSTNAVYSMRVKAGREPGIIDQPCLCIFGTAIPKHYYEALSLKMLTNGFFARMLVLETGQRGQGQDAVMLDLPPSIIDVARWWSEYRPGRQGNLDRWHPVPVVVPYTTEATSILRQLRAHADQQYALAEDRDDPVGMAIWARANEKARRLALVYACSENHEDPEIGEAAAQWASAFVDHQTRRMLFMSGGHVSENEFDARCKAVVATLRRWRERRGDAWMPFWQINRRHPWSEREHEDVRTTLLNQRLIEYEERRTGGTPQRLYRLA